MRKYLKVFAVLFALVILGGIFTIFSNSVGASGKEFSDVYMSPSTDAYKAIYWAVDKGVTTGIKNTDRFAPEDPCTRSQAVTFLWRLAGKPNPKTTKSSFSDIDSKFKKERPEMYKAILWASEKKIVAGYSDGTFRPNTKCSRAHIATFLYRYAGKPGFNKYSKQKSPFTDVSKSIGKDMYPAILWAKDKGITTGISGTSKFSPKGDCSRKQIVTFLWRYEGKPIATPTPTPVPNASFKRVTLDGNVDHSYVAKDYCYIESKKYFLLLEKDVKLPGDFTKNVDAIIDELESQLGLRYDPDDFDYSAGSNFSNFYDTGKDPWTDFEYGRKIPILILVDRNDSGYNSRASDNFVLLYSYDLMTDDVWNSVPSYKNNPGRRLGYFDYSELAHELTHVITLRHCHMTQILDEGIAQYLMNVVIDKLADKYPSLAKVRDNRYDFDYEVPETVTAENAERIFIEDYEKKQGLGDCSHYTYGKYLFMYLNQKHGANYYKKYSDACVTRSLDASSGYDEATAKKFANTLKSTFGNDVFTRFGAWCVEKDVLQNVSVPSN